MAGSFGFDTDRKQIGLRAQQVQSVLPELVEPAPFDRNEDGTSKSGENYLTIKYDRLIPVLVEGIKTLDDENRELKSNIKSLEDRLKRLENLLDGD